MRIVREPDENGWFKLETFSDLPINDMFLYWVYDYSGNIYHDINLKSIKHMFVSGSITHFKPMVTKPPVK